LLFYWSRCPCRLHWIIDDRTSAIAGVRNIQTAQWVLYSLFMLLILEVIFSWVNPHAPLAPFVRALNEPLLSPIRRVVPAIGG
jgi:YggT family protein